MAVAVASPYERTARKPLRLWPGVVAVVLQWLTRFVVPVFRPDDVSFAIIGGIVGGLAVLVWWLFFSRAPWSERLGALALIAIAMFATTRIVHESIADGAMGMLFPILAIPGLSLALVAWAVVSRHFAALPRRVALVAAILVACGVWTLVRTGGFTGDFDHDFQWRWTPSPEERLLAKAKEEPIVSRPVPAPAPVPEKEVAAKVDPTPAPAPREVVRESPQNTAAWPGFRGPQRDGAVSGVTIATDWSAHPPVKLWDREIGPGWSSFAVRGDRFYTQEQRGPDEIVACYELKTGKPVWTHRDEARFWESNAGAGPRATPTLGNDRLYTFGATGILNALTASDGRVLWSRNAAKDTDTAIPEWGFSSSPLLYGDMVIVAVSGQLAAYDVGTGAPRWRGPRGGISYSSPHLLNADGVPQILLVSREGVSSVSPADGKLLWEHAWTGAPIVQPAQTPDGDVLISVKEGGGTRRLAIDREPGGWRVEERWTSIGLKPYFNDFVVHEGHAFGFDRSILSCIDLKDGQRKWKGGRYGYGQLVLLPDQDLLLVLSEEGELALVKATPDNFTEVARMKAIEGKTWNHPVLIGDVLLARNGEQMAAFRLSVRSR